MARRQIEILEIDEKIVAKELDKHDFDLLLDSCFSNSDTFSLTLAGCPGKITTLRDELKPYIQGKIITTRWFCYGVSEKNPLHINLYQVNNTTKELMKEYYPWVFMEDGLSVRHQWVQDVEDMCFFKSNKLILGTVSHECICLAFPPKDGNFASELQKIVRGWKAQDDDENEHIDIGKYNILSA